LYLWLWKQSRWWPQLIHLNCYNVIELDDDKSEIMMKLNQLTYLTISTTRLIFDKFREFFMNISSKLKVLVVEINCSDHNYLNATEYEESIVQDTSFLNKFVFWYSDIIDRNFEIQTYHMSKNYFTSSFWINRNWLFKLVFKNNKIVYFIRPKK